MTFAARSREIRIDGTKTRVSLERPFWLALKEIAHSQGVRTDQIIRSINSSRAPSTRLACSIRVFVLTYFQRRKDEPVAAGEVRGQDAHGSPCPQHKNGHGE